MRNQRRRQALSWWRIAGIVGAALVAVVLIVRPWNLFANQDNKQEQRGSEMDNNESAAESLSQGGPLEPGAMLNQTLTYLPCGHIVQRRVDAPTELIGMDRTGIEKALPDYRVTAFSGKEAAMRRDMSMFCPDHWVLMPDAQGELCIWQNLMGEEMVRLRGLGIGAEDVPESEQNAVRSGKAFSSAEELEGWLESADS